MATVGGGNQFNRLLQEAQTGQGHLDVDSKNELVIRSNTSHVFRHAYAPEEYAYNVLENIKAKIAATNNKTEINELKKLAEKVGSDYQTLTKEQRKSIPKAKILTTISKLFHLAFPSKKHSANDVSNLLGAILGPGEVGVKEMGGTGKGFTKVAVNQHRNPDPAIQKTYKQITSAQNEYVRKLKENAPNNWEVLKLPADCQERKIAEKFLGDLAKKLNIDLAELKAKPIEESLNARRLDPKAPLRAITEAHLKEIGARIAYRKDLPDRIKQGAYNPAIIPLEIRQELGITHDYVPSTLNTADDVKRELKVELNRFRNHLTSNQLHYIKHDLDELVDLYRNAYPEKTMQQAYVLIRDAARAIVYQEIHDKASFTGSDHGSKHVHHNCKNADGIHEGMQGKASAKDRFLEHLIHAYHDMGYTVGLAATSFDCCKDHPFIGAKMLEENRAYFEELLDVESFETLHDSILCHAIALPDLTTTEEAVNGIHPTLVRAVTSISDACAVTYDRKTQEFWEQPGALIALTRLKLFLTQFPHYQKALSSPKIIEGDWKGAGLDPTKDPYDKLAIDIFQGTKNTLLELADSYKVAEGRKELFKGAINSQFNAFTANVTLGQYGGVLTDVTAVKNEDTSAGAPEYLPQFTMAPSLIYGVLKDLFGADQANEAFKKLAAEFGGDIKDIEGDIDAMARAIEKGIATEPKRKKTGLAWFNISGKMDVEEPVKEKDKAFKKHLVDLQKSLVQATKEVLSVYRTAALSVDTRKMMIEKLNTIRQEKSDTSFGQFLNGLIAQIRSQNPLSKTQLASLKKLMEIEKSINQFTDEEFARLQDSIFMIFLSQKEYDFMVKGVENPAEKGSF